MSRPIGDIVVTAAGSGEVCRILLVRRTRLATGESPSFNLGAACVDGGLIFGMYGGVRFAEAFVHCVVERAAECLAGALAQVSMSLPKNKQNNTQNDLHECQLLLFSGSPLLMADGAYWDATVEVEDHAPV